MVYWVISRPKRPDGLIVPRKPSPSKTKKPVIGTARATGIAAVEKRNRRANIFVSGFVLDHCPVASKGYSGAAFRTIGTCTKLEPKHPDDYSPFLVVTELDNRHSSAL